MSGDWWTSLDFAVAEDIVALWNEVNRLRDANALLEEHARGLQKHVAELEAALRTLQHEREQDHYDHAMREMHQGDK
jgi:hypothetical protein